MKKLKYYFLLIVVFLQVLAVQAQVPMDDIVKGKIRIKLHKEQLQELGSLKGANVTGTSNVLGVQRIDQLSDDMGVTRISRVFPFSPKNEERHRKHDLHLWYELDFDVSENPNGMAALYAELEDVAIAKPVYKKIFIEGEGTPVEVNVDSLRLVASAGSYSASTLKSTSGNANEAVAFNDPELVNQWHYENDGTIGAENVDIDLFKAWAKETGSTDVVVAIVDGGIDPKHEDLIDNLWVNEAELNGEPGVDDDQNGFIDDIHGFNFVYGGPVTAHFHGTHVAGTVAAVSNNGIGVAGIAGGDFQDGKGNGVRLMSCQAYDTRGGSGQGFAAAIVYGADNGAVISQNSWGYSTPGYWEPEVLDAIKYFKEEAGYFEGSPMQGGILFFASGNSGKMEEHYPAAHEEVIAVGSTGPEGNNAPYTTHGPWVDIVAPGGDQSGSFGPEGGVLSTLPNNKYGYQQGTSMACPHVSGVAALVVSKFGGPSFTAAELEQMILGSTTGLTFEHNDNYGIGNLNALNALAEDLRIAPNAIDDLSAFDIAHNELSLEWTVPVDSDDFRPIKFHLAVSGSLLTAKNFDQAQVFDLENPYEAGKNVQIRLPGLQKQTKYYFAVKSSDRYGNTSVISNVLEVTTTDAPYFKESTRELFFDIDVSLLALESKNIQFSNDGEGLVHWASETMNNSKLWIDLADWEETISEQAAAAAAEPQLYHATRPYLQSEEGGLKSGTKEHFLNDQTISVGGQSYETGNGYYDVVGSGSPNAGLIYGTRFQGPINLTHIEMALYFTQKEKPVTIEVKRGSERIEDANTVLVQEFFVDTVNVMNFWKMPLYQPQNMHEEEYFWVVLHFPKEEPYPLVVEQNAPYYEDAFMISTNNGYTYNEAYHTIGVNRVPTVRALTSGTDGAFAFIDPTSGSIKAGQPQDVKVTVDANYLSNGKHMATLSVYTTDIFKPGVAIDVKVNVSGQVAGFKAEDIYTFDAFANVEQEFLFDVVNSGYDTLTIKDVSDVNGYYTKAFEDSINILPQQKLSIPLNYLTTQTGIYNEDITVHTNIGDQVMTAQVRSAEAPTMTVSAASAVDVVVPYNGSADILVDITNTGTGSVLAYDINEYHSTRVYNGYQLNGGSYTITTSDDVGGPVANSWENIEPYAEIYPSDFYNAHRIKLKHDFPFFHTELSELVLNRFLQIYGAGKDENGVNTGFAFVSMDFKDANVSFKDAYYHDFGDRFVFTLIGYLNGDEFKNEPDIRTQVVLFADGTIEYRYDNVDAIVNNNLNNCVIGFKGFNTADTVSYARWDDGLEPLKNGLVLRFAPEKDMNLVSTDDTGGSIARGQAQQITFKVEPSQIGAPAGSYANTIRVKANTPDLFQEIPVNITVTGEPQLSLADTVAFDVVNTGQVGETFLAITNSGSDIETITAGQVVFGDNALSVLSELPFEIAPFSTQQLKVAYAPSVAGELSSSVIINFTNGQALSSIVTATAKVDPVMITNLPASIDEQINAGEMINIPFTIAATDADLEYSFTNLIFAKAIRDNQRMGEGFTEEDFQQLGEGFKAHADTYIYGYNWQEGEIHGADHRWDDLNDYDDVDTLHIIQGGQYVLDLGFEFPYYGEVFDTIWVSKNGYVTPILPQSDIVNLNFLKEDGIMGMIGPHVSSMIPDENGGGVLLRQLDDRVIIQWDKFIGDGGYMSYDVTFQLELVNDGSIYFHYYDIDLWDAPLNYGLESPDESETMEVYRLSSLTKNYKTINDHMTLALTPPSKGVVLEGTTANFNLQLSAKDLYADGVYQDTLALYSGSKTDALRKVPIRLTVNNGVSVVKAPVVIDAGQIIYKEGVTVNAKAQQAIVLTNKGRGIASVNKIPDVNLVGLSLYDADGNQLIRSSSSGLLSSPIVLNPWENDTLIVQVPVNTLESIDGVLSFEGNFESVSTQFVANVVSSPEFAWTAVDQNIEMLNSEEYEYTFSISNNGETDLNYKLLPTVVPKLQEGEYPGDIEEFGTLLTSNIITIDSVAHDRKQLADGYQKPYTAYYTNLFDAPEGGLMITHVKVNINLPDPNQLVDLHIAVGGGIPLEGAWTIPDWDNNVEWPDPDTTLIPGIEAYRQTYRIPEQVTENWVYFPLEEPVSIQDGEHFWVSVKQSGAMGYDNHIGEQYAMEDTIRTGADHWKYPLLWNPTESDRIWKIRPVTGIGDDGQWLTAEPLNGTVAGGESVDITTTVSGDFANKGEHEGQLIVVTNDVSNKKNRINYNVKVNGYPELVFKPNSYQDTLRMVETETHFLNYVFEDPEDEAVTFSMDEINNDSIKVITETVSAYGAKVKVITNYDSDGYYEIPVSLTDAAGNVLSDTIRFEVADLNRTPYFNPVYRNIEINLADPNPMIIKINDLFIDPDGDKLYLQAGNINQQVLDMALGYDYITLHPKASGIGFLVFAADDGKENGYKFDYSTVIVTNNPDAVPNDLNSFEGNEHLMEQLAQGMVISPNLVQDQPSNVLFNLEEDADVRLELYNMKGQYIDAYLNTKRGEGLNQEQVDFSTLTPGLYLCRFVVNNEVKNTVKIIVK
ncbi:S8 family serine peptidase [Carboxylicivirga marina]|uniref:S8 family serine peptidase n=1 Tax=Carboxylicivirga marina TaxID=2800988 RepID=UPI00259A4074|nr:S8 family serine peptidase [uncultured Carboxylicivirga sp.]